MADMAYALLLVGGFAVLALTPALCRNLQLLRALRINLAARGYEIVTPRTAEPACAPPPIGTPMSSCSTSGSPTSTAATSSPSCAA